MAVAAALNPNIECGLRLRGRCWRAPGLIAPRVAPTLRAPTCKGVGTRA